MPTAQPTAFRPDPDVDAAALSVLGVVRGYRGIAELRQARPAAAQRVLVVVGGEASWVLTGMLQRILRAHGDRIPCVEVPACAGERECLPPRGRQRVGGAVAFRRACHGRVLTRTTRRAGWTKRPPPGRPTTCCWPRGPRRRRPVGRRARARRGRRGRACAGAGDGGARRRIAPRWPPRRAPSWWPRPERRGSISTSTPRSPRPRRKPTGHRFTAQATGDVRVIAAVRELPGRLRDGLRLRLTWRLTPAGPASGPLPHPVLLVETPSGGRPGEVLAYQIAAALDAGRRARRGRGAHLGQGDARLPRGRAARLRAAGRRSPYPFPARRAVGARGPRVGPGG